MKEQLDIKTKDERKELPQYSNIVPVEYFDLSISIKILSAWWLAKEDIAIHKFSSLITSQLLSHEYNLIQLLWTFLLIY